MKKNRLVFALLSAALVALPALSHAGQTRFNLLCVYKLANGQGVAVAIPGEWQELNKTRVLEPGAAARFLDGAGRLVEVPPAALERASKARTVVWPEHVKTSIASQ